ncbi:het domain-containing protein [Fusarium pseudocircinatum]|uniref:Het domain-containing protein n=1 Tax=Fusarium pseudocircinatum TaxID=56676 RepID=A0A8H5PX13_9HYPO|nr:het domain-containing protein [Fusarium pseudocircinatum]
MDEPVGRLSDLGKTLPGCRPCGLDWNKCTISIEKVNEGILIHFKMHETIWARKLKGNQGKLQCNLQELQIFRWAVEENKTSASQHLKDYHIVYIAESRYGCLFPHQDGACHEVLEVSSGITKEEIQNLGKLAIQHSMVFLCPVPAILCEETQHRGTEEEICDLATYWPMRQIISAQAVEGIIDVTPVAICHDDPLNNRCTLLYTVGSVAKGLPTTIRINQSLGELATTIGYIEWKGRNNPATALHASWADNLSHAIQPAVLQCRDRKALTQPTRLYNAHSKNRELLTEVQTEPPQYLALSYCWKEWPEKEDNALTVELEKISRKLAIQYFWIDRRCIDQNDESDKAREIPRMRDYYEGASACVVLTGSTVETFKCLPSNGAIVSAYQQIMLNASPLRSLFRSQWPSRIWTLQEALMSRQVIYSVQDQLIDGDYISELISYIETLSEYYDPSNMDDPEWVGGYASYGWNAKSTSIVYPRQLRIREGTKNFTLLRTVFGGEQQYQEIKSGGGIAVPFEEALVMTSDRYAAREEDYVYGILGITLGGRDIKIEYDLGWHAMLSKLKQAGMITEMQLASGSVNQLPGMSWLPGYTHGQGLFRHVERLATFLHRPQLTWNEHGAIVVGAAFEWIEADFDNQGKLTNRGMPCRVTDGKIQFPGVPGLVARVRILKSYGLGPWFLSHTHIMLCRDIEKSTSATVAIKVIGDIAGGAVAREDGYVLEIKEWLEGDPSMLKERSWLVGSAPP